MSDERILELIEKQDKYYVLGFIKGIKANRDELIEENVELKSQLDEANKKLYLCTPEIPQNVHGEYVSYVDLVNEIYELKKQQQEFIKWLKDEINKTDYEVNILGNYPYLAWSNACKKNLQKYKEIIGVKND